jgi:hypothetical protein
MDVLLSAQKLVERLGKEEQALKKLGLHGHAAGIRAAITILIRETHATQSESPQPQIGYDCTQKR